jgi:hypothetical protein
MGAANANANAAPEAADSDSDSDSASLLSRTILTPILFLSFLLSLLVVDWRTSATLFPPTFPAVTRSSPATGTGPHRGRNKEKEKEAAAGPPPPHYHHYQTKLAKREIDEAFALRRRVMAGMCAVGAVGVGVAVGMGWRLMSRAWAVWGKGLGGSGGRGMRVDGE